MNIPESEAAMRDNANWRYFLAAHPEDLLRRQLTSLQWTTGQRERRVKPANLHLTICTIAELEERDRFILSRVEAALSGLLLVSGLLRLGRVRGGARGAMVASIGPKPELLALYRTIAARLSERGLPPLHRKSGLHPHVTLGYDPCWFECFEILHEWIPDELLLIASEIGKGIHTVLGRWPLLPPAQGRLPFDTPSPPALSLLSAAGGG
jgi:2'-5' RNA ligase